MSLRIQQTETFEITFNALVSFIRGNWGDKIANEFVVEAERIIQLISNFPHICKSTSFDEEIRVAYINKLSSLFYEVDDDVLTLLYIVDSRQEPLVKE